MTQPAYEQQFRNVAPSVYASDEWLVVTGTPKENDPDHNCDAMGCGQHHVIFRAALAPSPRLVSASPAVQDSHPSGDSERLLIERLQVLCPGFGRATCTEIQAAQGRRFAACAHCEAAESLSRLREENSALRKEIVTDNSAVIATLQAEVERLAGALREERARLDWWFAYGLEESVCDGSVDLWWVGKDSDRELVTHGTELRATIDSAMRGEYDDDSTPTLQETEGSKP